MLQPIFLYCFVQLDELVDTLPLPLKDIALKISPLITDGFVPTQRIVPELKFQRFAVSSIPLCQKEDGKEPYPF